MALNPRLRLLFAPFTRNGLKRVTGSDKFAQFVCAPLGSGIKVGLKTLALIVAPLAGILQRRRWINAQR